MREFGGSWSCEDHREAAESESATKQLHRQTELTILTYIHALSHSSTKTIFFACPLLAPAFVFCSTRLTFFPHAVALLPQRTRLATRKTCSGEVSPGVSQAG